MSNPYIGEIRMFGGNFPPLGWAFCDGQLAPISENDALFNLIGTTYGGDGQSTFAYPDLRGRTPIHQGASSGLNNHTIGESGGAEATTPSGSLQNAPQIPALQLGEIGTVGVSPVPTMMPFLAINFILSLYGVFPSPN